MYNVQQASCSQRPEKVQAILLNARCVKRLDQLIENLRTLGDYSVLESLLQLWEFKESTRRKVASAKFFFAARTCLMSGRAAAR